jgi:RNA polymerase sigma factor FliA
MPQPGSAGPGDDPDLSVLPSAGRVLGGGHAGAAGADGAVPDMVRRMTQSRQSNSDGRRSLIECNLEAVHGWASYWGKTLPPFVDRDEIMADATVGLVEAAMTFDPDRGDFYHFMWRRVRGAVRDGLARRHDGWGHRPKDRAARAAVTISLDSPIHDQRGELLTVADALADPHDEYELVLTRIHADAVSNVTANLPERLRNVLRWRWHECRSGSQIGRWLGVTESRVCQLNAEALARLRDNLAPHE